MHFSQEEIRNKLAEKGLKVTPQRLAILDAVYVLGSHPTAENIIEYIRQNNPNIASGTVYKVLETLIENKLVRKVYTDKDVMRYDGVMKNHHHLYCADNEVIEDYVDEKLDLMLQEYFKTHKINDFQIDEIVLQINGKYDKR
jgi:Fur family transcriptional regulator, peroxide stress response regulator